MSLIHEGENDYLLPEGHDSVWVKVGNIAVYINRQAHGVAVRLWPEPLANTEPLEQCFGFFEDAAQCQ